MCFEIKRISFSYLNDYDILESIKIEYQNKFIKFYNSTLCQFLKQY